MASAGIAVQLSKYIPLLASDKTGEILAAVNAMDRALRREGRDFHDLAGAVERGWSVPATAAPPPTQPMAWWQATARSCILAAHNLKTTEADFLRGMTTWPTEPSQKQRVWLTAIAQALGVGCPA